MSELEYDWFSYITLKITGKMGVRLVRIFLFTFSKAIHYYNKKGKELAHQL